MLESQLQPQRKLILAPMGLDPGDVTYHHCHATAEDLTRRVALFEAKVNQDSCVVADRLWVKDCLDPEEEKLRF